MKSFEQFLREQSFPDHWQPHEIEQYKWELRQPAPEDDFGQLPDDIQYKWSDGTLHDEPEPPPFVEVPPGSGNWEHSNEFNPPAGWGHTYMNHHMMYNINTGQWEQIQYNSETNQWEFTEPTVTLWDILQGICPQCNPDEVPNWGMPGEVWVFVGGEWVVAWPPNLVSGDTQSYDTDEWGDCAGPAGSCMSRNFDGDWFIWDGENWVPFEEGVDYTGADDIPQHVIDAILNDPGNMDEILDDYLNGLSL